MNLTAVIMLSAGVFPLLYALRRTRPAAMLLSAVSGLASLFAADVILGFTGLDLPVNGFTLSCAAAGGIPGVILLLLLNALLAAN